MTAHFLVSCTLLPLIAFGGTAAAAASAQTEGRVDVEVYADVSSIAPGSTFHLAVHYRIEKDWHIYWLNPGDSGMPTTVEITAPEGFRVGPVFFPGPRRIGPAEEMTTYGYEGEATVIAEIKAPDYLKPGASLRFDVQTDWLVCKATCLLGSARASVTLRASAEARPSDPANADRFKSAKARLPRPLKEFTLGKAGWTGPIHRPRFEATVPAGVEIDFFPLIVEAVDAGDVDTVKLDDGSSRLAVAFDVDVNRLGPAPPPTVGVLRVKKGDEEMFFDLVPHEGK